MARQEPLALGDELASLCAPLSRPLAQAWDDLPPGWRRLAAGLQSQAEVVTRAVDDDRLRHEVVPARPFRAFELVAPQDVRLILIGQDPYPLPGDATGLAFSCVRGVPASMRNVYAALEASIPGFVRPRVADLEPWARQGVLLLNAALTVRMGKKMAGSHLQLGWQAWTGGVLRALYEERLRRGGTLPVAWLWGKPAAAFFDAALSGLQLPEQRVLRARHPAQDFKREFVVQAAQHLRQLRQLLEPPLRW